MNLALRDFSLSCAIKFRQLMHVIVAPLGLKWFSKYSNCILQFTLKYRIDLEFLPFDLQKVETNN